MIVIPNMEKPKSCDDCTFEGEDWGCVIIPDAWWLRTMEEVYKHCPLIDIVTCGECIWKEECTITELWGGRGFCPSGERRAEQSQINTIENTNDKQSEEAIKEIVKDYITATYGSIDNL